MIFYSFFCLCFCLSCTMTWCFRHYAISKKLLDLPNHRSAHVQPTPRGAGIVFSSCSIVAVLFLFSLKQIPFDLFVSLIFGGSLIAALGFVDDKNNIAAKWRLICHFIISFMILYFLGDTLKSLGFHSSSVLNALIGILAIFYMVWLINLYNFMDGIDGFAAIEFLTTCLGMVLLYSMTSHVGMAKILIAFMCTVGGFLVFNFPPARVFMGDVGSTFLGVTTAIFSLQSLSMNPLFFLSWIILLAVFIVDASFTLLQRFLLGQLIYESHQNHCYQIMTRKLGTHLPVTLGLMGINVLWLLPLSLLTGLQYIPGSLGIILAYGPLIFLFYRWRKI